jgi:uncharacterized membrane protein
MNLLPQMPKIDHERVVAAITAAEARTSGEIRVFISKQRAEDPVAAAEHHFERLGMTKTAERNAVLVFLCPTSHTFAVIGDSGIHRKCGEGFWRELADAMVTCFKRGDFTSGLVLGIERAGDLLAGHFPRKPDDQDELPNRIEVG